MTAQEGVSRPLDAFLRRHALKHLPLFNAGIVGGLGRVWRPFWAELCRAVRRHYQHLLLWHRHRGASAPASAGGGGLFVDMLALNELLLARYARDASSVVTGWPNGRVNLPMWSNFCFRPDGAACRQLWRNRTLAPSVTAARFRRCVDRTLIAMAPAYVFVHKVAWMEHGDVV